MEIPFIGGAYTGYSRNINAQRCVNLFPVIDQQDAKSVLALYGTPGLVEFIDTSKIIVRGMHEFITDVGAYGFGRVLYYVADNTVYSVTYDGNIISTLGTITTNSGNVFMADNGTEVIIVDGTPNGYLITGGVLSAITDTDFPVATTVTYQDGYFIVTANDLIYISGLYDGTSWNALDFASAEANPDSATRVISNSKDLWIFGTSSVEIFYNSGAADFPFVRIPGAVIELGLDALASAVKINGIIYWLSAERKIVRGQGYQYAIVSTPQIDYQISTYSKTDDAIGFTYQLLGHIFYVITFPTADKTWVYDVTTSFWHEWSSFITAGDSFNLRGRHRANCIEKFGDKYIVGDYKNGKLYQLDMDTYTDDSNEIIRTRATRVINKERLNVTWSRLEVEFESGVGLVTGQGSDPQAILAWSDDGGHTWSNNHAVSIGAIGKYKKRAVWRRLGSSRNRILRVSISDPVKVVMLGAHADVMESRS